MMLECNLLFLSWSKWKDEKKSILADNSNVISCDAMLLKNSDELFISSIYKIIVPYEWVSDLNRDWFIDVMWDKWLRTMKNQIEIIRIIENLYILKEQNTEKYLFIIDIIHAISSRCWNDMKIVMFW